MVVSFPHGDRTRMYALCPESKIELQLWTGSGGLLFRNIQLLLINSSLFKVTQQTRRRSKSLVCFGCGHGRTPSPKLMYNLCWPRPRGSNDSQSQPQFRPVVITIFTHVVCPSVHTSSVSKLKYQAEITAGRDCGLSEWIIDDSCLVFNILLLGLPMALLCMHWFGRKLGTKIKWNETDVP